MIKKKRKNIVTTFFRRLFCHRNIIIIADHKTEHLPLSGKMQLFTLTALLAFVIWASYSTGNYMAAQETLAEKERKIVSTSLENRRIESEFSLLKRDLVKMLDTKETKGELGEYATFVIEQYKNGDQSLDQVDFSQLGSEQHGAVFERIAFLEKQMDALKNNHTALLESIRRTAKGKIEELEKLIKITGLSPKKLEKKVAILSEEADPSGGPYEPLDDEPLQEYDEELFEDINRATLLSDVINHLPLAKPMKGEYRITSGYGMRVDPFRKRLARHAGLDFAGAHGAKVYSTNTGKVAFAGRRGAYGLMVEIDHGLGITTRYGHLRKIMVKEGDEIDEGQHIAIQGSTGRSTGPHLHYEVRYQGATLNPKDFLEAGNHVRQK